MDCQIANQPLGPGSFPFRQKTESPLYRAEDGQHAKKYLLTVDCGPPTNAEHDKCNEHNYFVDSDYCSSC